MKMVILIVCVILLFCYYRTAHIYKSEHTGISKYNIGFVLGTIVTAAINGFAWYYIFKMMDILK
jgi:hypothetical protein